MCLAAAVVFVVLQYTQDHNGFLPVTTDYAAFQAAVQPYIGTDASIFVSPGRGLPYALNPAISGLSLWNIPDPTTTVLMRDARRNADGSFYTAFLSGSVQQDVVNVPLVLSLGSANVGVDNKTHISLSSFTGFALETLSATGTVETRHDYGIYDGWQSFAAGGSNGTLHRVFLRYDGTLALWNLSPDGQYLRDSRLLAPPKKTTVGAAVGGDALTRVLWSGERKEALLWRSLLPGVWSPRRPGQPPTVRS